MREDDKNITGYDEPMGLGNADEQMALSNADEQLLQAFFADHQEEIADDGFSDRVMQHLPAPSHRRMERWWQVACIVMGVVFIVSTQMVSSLEDSLFASKVTAMMLLSKALCSLGELIAQPQQLLMLLAGMVTILCVWGYNKVLDARIEM
jgi:hypothetical protein